MAFQCYLHHCVPTMCACAHTHTAVAAPPYPAHPSPLPPPSPFPHPQPPPPVCWLLQVALGPGQGVITIRVRSLDSSELSNEVVLWYSTPLLTSARPSLGGSGGTLVTLNGTNLGRPLVATTPQGCVAVNRVMIGPWVCVAIEVRWARVKGTGLELKQGCCCAWAREG